MNATSNATSTSKTGNPKSDPWLDSSAGVWPRDGHKLVGFAFWPIVCLAVFLPTLGYPAQSNTVANCTEADLRAALANGGAVTFACDGTITLAGTLVITNDTVLDGSRRQVVISGGDAVRVFRVETNVSLTLINLTVTRGRSTNGAALCNNGGRVILSGIMFIGNRAGALRLSGDGHGGAIVNQPGVVCATNCVFVGNSAQGDDATMEADAGQAGAGGAIYSAGELYLADCTFSANSAMGGAGQRGISPETFVGGGLGGVARGGAVCTLGAAIFDRCLFACNVVTGGAGGAGGDGSAAITLFTPGGDGGMGGHGQGGAVFNGGNSILVNCTLTGNDGTGGEGGLGGRGGYDHYHGTDFYTAGGRGGDGGNAVGGLCSTTAQFYLTNCTVAFNHGIGGSGSDGGLGVPPGGYGGVGEDVGGVATVGGGFVNTLLATNAPGNGAGPVLDLGHNLCSDNTCAFTNAGSLNNTDPNLGPLANSGGPTLTMALLPGSPAIDAGNTAAAPVGDQRGLPRPYGQAADIGAYEYWLSAKALPCRTGGVDILALGIEGQNCRLLVSSNLINWSVMATKEIGADWTALFHDDADGHPQRFFRLMLP